MNEILVYAGIERIGWDAGVSEPVKEPPEQTMNADRTNVENKLDAILSRYEE
jgi:hypothetical protein